MRVKIVRSPDPKKKFRAILESGKTVDFGARGYSDYTKHKTPSRMRSYVLRQGPDFGHVGISGVFLPLQVLSDLCLRDLEYRLFKVPELFKEVDDCSEAFI